MKQIFYWSNWQNKLTWTNLPENIDLKVLSASNGRVIILPKCGICGSKKSKFIKNQGGKALLTKLVIKTPLSKIPILGDILF